MIACDRFIYSSNLIDGGQGLAASSLPNRKTDCTITNVSSFVTLHDKFNLISTPSNRLCICGVAPAIP